MAKANLITIGREFGRLTVLSEAEKSGKHRRWNCECKCGSVGVFYDTNLKRGLSESCGCAWKTQGGESTSREWGIWYKMLARCYSETNDNYRFYGGIGVIVCQHWRASFANFLYDMGRATTTKHTLDRIEPAKNYTCGRCEECLATSQPLNCRWATKKEQDRNRRQHQTGTHNGKTMLLKEWAESEFAAVGYHALYSRILRGWSFWDALTMPPNTRKPKTISHLG